MRFSTFRRSISVSIRLIRNSRRSRTFVFSSTACFSSILIDICAAMVSARREGSSILESDERISGGTFLFSFTYCSNWLKAGRNNTLTARSSGDSSSSNSRTGKKHGIGFDVIDYARALGAFHQHLDSAIRQL